MSSDRRLDEEAGKGLMSMDAADQKRCLAVLVLSVDVNSTTD
jgi:hypothetical protein